MALSRQQNSHIPYIIASRPGDDRIAEGVEEIERVAVLQTEFRRNVFLFAPPQRIGIDHRSGGGAIAVNAVSARAQHYNIRQSALTQMNGGAQRELLIAPALPVAANRTDRFSPGQQAHGLSAMCVAQRDDALDVSQHHRLDVPLDQIFGDLDDAAEVRLSDPLRFDERSEEHTS